MIHQDEYERAKEIVARFEKERGEAEKSVECTLEGLQLRRGKDGHWLCFDTKQGTHAMLNIENVFNGEHVTDTAIKDWAKEQHAIK